MAELNVSECLDILRKRALPPGGFIYRAGGDYRPDATAWAVLALEAAKVAANLCDAARSRLAADQQADGRVPISPSHPEAIWPTALAALAWAQAPAQKEEFTGAVRFLLASSGLHPPNREDWPVGYDTSIKGWAYTENTLPWVEPTAMAVIALRLAGQGKHERVNEAQRLLLDRQFSRGGWNFGCTTIFQREFSPMPSSTGAALNALAGLLSREKVTSSLAYLHAQVNSLRTPWSLGWALLGLGAWGERPSSAPVLLGNCFKRQERYGSYDTAAIALLVIARLAAGGLDSVIRGKGLEYDAWRSQ